MTGDLDRFAVDGGLEQFLEYLKTKMGIRRPQEERMAFKKYIYYEIKRARGESMTGWINRSDEALMDTRKKLASAHGANSSESTMIPSTNSRLAASPPGPDVRRIYDVHYSLYRHSQRSRRPQPRGGGGDATSRKDTRQDRWLYFDCQLRWSLCKVSFRGSPTPRWGGPKCRESGRLAADTTKSSGSLHFPDDTESQNHLPENLGSLWADIGAACPQIQRR